MDDSTVSVLQGLGNGNFAPAVTYPVGLYPEAVAVGSFTANGHADIVTANAGADTVSVLLGNGKGSFSPDTFHSPGLAAGTFAVGSIPTSVTVADFGNGHLDIVTADSDLWAAAGDKARFRCCWAAATGRLPRPQLTMSVLMCPIAVTAGIFGPDGTLDLVTANYEGGTVSVLAGLGGGTFAAPVSYQVGLRPLRWRSATSPTTATST